MDEYKKLSIGWTSFISSIYPISSLSFSAGLYHLSLPLRAVFLAAIMEKVQEGSEDKTEIVEPPLGWGYK